MLEALGFERNQFIEGMDFKNILIINGHGADNQKAVLTRLRMEFNAGNTEIMNFEIVEV